MEKRWLVRSDHEIRGPYTRSEIERQILSGQIILTDELCPNSGKWAEVTYCDEFQKSIKEAIANFGRGEQTAILAATETTALEAPATAKPHLPPKVPLVTPAPPKRQEPVQMPVTPPLWGTRGVHPTLIRAAIVISVVAALLMFWFLPTEREREGRSVQKKTGTQSPAMALFSRGLTYEMAGLSQEARRNYHELFERHQDWKGSLALARLDYFQSGEASSVMRRLDDLLQQKSCEFACQAEILNQKGVIEIDLKRYAQAERDLTRAGELKGEMAAVQFNLGKVHYLKADYEKARIHFEAAAEREPTVVITYTYLGRSYDKLGRYAEAIAEFQNAMRVNSNLMLPYLYAAVVSYRLEQPKEVLENLRTLLLQDPKYGEATYPHPDYSHDEINPPEVLRVYQIIVRGLENLPEVQAALALFHFLAGQQEKAKEIAQLSIKRFPKDAYGRVVLGLIALEQGDREGAKEAFRLALRYNFQHKLAHLLLAHCYALDLNFELARTHYQRVLAFDSRSVMAHYGLGNVYASEGAFQTAIASWERAIEIDPTFMPARRKLLEAGTRH